MADLFIAEDVSAEGTDKKIILVVHHFKQKYILGLVRKENLQDMNQHSRQYEGRKSNFSTGSNTGYRETQQ